MQTFTILVFLRVHFVAAAGCGWRVCDTDKKRYDCSYRGERYENNISYDIENAQSIKKY
jgi:hypothetical protein